MNLENPVVSGYGFPPIKDAEVIGVCRCGCGEEIVKGYEHLYWEGDYFFEQACLNKFIGAEWKVVGEE